MVKLEKFLGHRVYPAIERKRRSRRKQKGVSREGQAGCRIHTYRTREAQGWREKRVVVSSSKKMKSTRFRGGWLHTGPSPRRREGGGAFFKVGGMRGRPGVQSGSRRLVACQRHDVPLVPRDRWIYTHSLSSPSTLVVALSSALVIGVQFVIGPTSIQENRRSFWFTFRW